jgi:hypothetical protein
MAEQAGRLGKAPHAMVLAGGGAFGAYGIGVMKALFSGQSPSTELNRINPRSLPGPLVSIELGFENASRHNCKKEGCILPFADPSPPSPGTTVHPQVIGL